MSLATFKVLTQYLLKLSIELHTLHVFVRNLQVGNVRIQVPNYKLVELLKETTQYSACFERKHSPR